MLLSKHLINDSYYNTLQFECLCSHIYFFSSAIGVMPRNYLMATWIFTCVFFWKILGLLRFYILHLKSLIHMEYILLLIVKWWSDYLFFPNIVNQFSQHLMNKQSFAHRFKMLLLSYTKFPFTLVCEFSLLFHRCVYWCIDCCSVLFIEALL